MAKVVFDSSFLMAIADVPTTWFEDMVMRIGKFEALVPECVLRELRRIANHQGRRSRTARVALEIAGGFKPLDCGDGSVDDCVLVCGRREGALVATLDREMLVTLKRSRKKAVTLHGGRVAIE